MTPTDRVNVVRTGPTIAKARRHLSNAQLEVIIASLRSSLVNLNDLRGLTSCDDVHIGATRHCVERALELALKLQEGR